MKILLTGSAGFIGMHVARRLVDLGHVVAGVDNLNDYYDVQLKRDRHAELGSLAGFQAHVLDLTDAPALRQLFEAERFDSVCHLAAQAGVRYSLDHPEAYQKANLEAFVNVLENCRHQKIKRLVYASSSSVYGGNTKMPFAETDRVDHPVSLYAATKKANELMAHTYTHLYGLQTVGLRFFTVYGPWGRPDMALWMFTDKLLRGESIRVFNHGRMQRDFTYIDDIVRGVVASLTVEDLAPYEVINLGNNNPENLLDMISVLSETIGVEPQMKMLPMQPGDVPATCANIELAGRKLGYKPTTPISEGIPKFVDWFTTYQKQRNR